MKSIKGFTLIELIVTLGLAGIILTVVMSFFISNYRSYETINTKSEVQYQSQYIINYMTNVILEAEKYEGLGTFKFINGERAKFEVIDNKIKHTTYNSDGTTKKVDNIGNNVYSIHIENSTNEVELTLKLIKENYPAYEAKQVIYMRNSVN